jgi:protein-S-isoprenylcysteine O-methyltransferase Ste14
VLGLVEFRAMRTTINPLRPDCTTALAGAAFFVIYITCLQIIPEERVLKQRFGAEFSAYSARVRRWL